MLIEAGTSIVSPISDFLCETGEASVGDSILTALVFTPTLAEAPMSIV